MNIRKRAILAMEMLARSVNDERAMEGWLMNGIPDGDISYGSQHEEIVDEYFTKEENFKDLIDTFMRTMIRAYNSGGLYIDGIVGGSKDD